MQIGGRDYDGAAAYLMQEAQRIQQLASGRTDITVEVQLSHFPAPERLPSKGYG